MKVQISAFLVYEQPWNEDDHGFKLVSIDPTGVIDGWVLVGRPTIEVDVPDDYDPRPQMVKALEAEKEKARADFAKRVMEIDRRINELLALEHTA